MVWERWKQAEVRVKDEMHRPILRHFAWVVNLFLAVHHLKPSPFHVHDISSYGIPAFVCLTVVMLKLKQLFSFYKGSTWVAEGCKLSHTRKRRRREKGRRLRLISSVHFLCLQAGRQLGSLMEHAQYTIYTHSANSSQSRCTSGCLGAIVMVQFWARHLQHLYFIQQWV